MLEPQTHLIVQQKELFINSIPENGKITVQGTMSTSVSRGLGLISVGIG